MCSLSLQAERERERSTNMIFLRPFGATERLSNTLRGSAADPDLDIYLSFQTDLCL